MIERISYRGWDNAWRISNGTVELTVLADVGPRIVRYGFCGAENILHEVAGDSGRTGGTDFRLYGGHRLWVWPEVASTYFPDNDPAQVTQNGDSIRFVSPVEDRAPGTHIQKQLEVSLDAIGSRVRVVHTLTNHASKSTEMAVWCPTMMQGEGRAILPLPPRVAMDTDHFQSVGPLTLWSFTDLADPRWRFGTEFIQLEQKEMQVGRFPEQMSGTFNPAGWGAYYSRGTLFVKRAVCVPGARYPDFGCNFEVFTNLEFLELETLGPVVQVGSGESITHTETWALFRDVAAGKDDGWVRHSVVPLADSVIPF